MKQMQPAFMVDAVTLVEAVVRAKNQGLKVTPVPRSTTRLYMVSSGSKEGVVYYASPERCSCPAGQRGTFCKHRALVLMFHIDDYVDCIDRSRLLPGAELVQEEVA
jgi:hypothetical protein